MAKKNSKSARKLRNPVEDPSTSTKKRLKTAAKKRLKTAAKKRLKTAAKKRLKAATKNLLKPVEDPSTSKRRLQLLEEDDSPIKNTSPQPLENAPVESSGDDEEMATEEEEDAPAAPVKTPGKNISTPCASASVIVSSTEEQSSDADSGSESENVPESESEEKEPNETGETQPNDKTEVESEVVATREVKKEYFQRKWSEDDEIVLLQGMVDFNTNEGKSANEDMPAFFDTVKNKISFGVENMNQVQTKIRRLKERYMRKRVKGVVVESIANAHDRKWFELANVIWGSCSVDDEKVPSDWFVNSFLVGALVSFGMDESEVKQRWSMVPVKAKKKIEKKFNVFQAKEFQFLLQKATVLQEVVAMLAGAN